MKQVYKYDTSARGFKVAAWLAVAISLVILFLGIYFVVFRFRM